MNNIFRVIWNSALRCFIVASELAKGKTKSRTRIAAGVLATTAILTSLPATAALSRVQLAVDGVSVVSDNNDIATRDLNNHAIVVSNGGDLTFSNAQATTTGTGANAALVQNASTIALNNVHLGTFSPNAHVISLTGASRANLSDTTMMALAAGSYGINVTGNSQLTGSNIGILSAATGIYVENSTVNLDTLKIDTSGTSSYGIYALGTDANAQIKNTTINTTGASAIGLYANNGGRISGQNVNINTAANNARGVYAVQAGSKVILDGGSITTSGAGSHGVYAGLNGSAEVSNMDITTTATLQAQAGGSAALYAERGGYIKADNLTLTSRSNAISLNAATIDGSNLRIIQNYGNYGPAIWGLANSVLNLKNSDIALMSSDAQGIYTDAGTANLDGVTIHSDVGGTGLTVRYDGTLMAKNLDIALNNADGDYASGLYMSRGSGKTQATIEDSRIVVNGRNATAIIATISRQNAAIKNTLVASDNIAVKVSNGAGLSIIASGSTFIAPTLLSAGEINTTGTKTGNVYLDVSDGSQLQGDVDLKRDYVTDSRLSLDTGSLWQGASTDLNTLNLSNGSQWNMTGDSNVHSLNLADSTIVFNHDSDSFKTLTVDGNFASHGGTLVMNSVLADDGAAHDAMKVTGNTSGDTNVMMNRAGGSGAQTIQGIEVISVAGDSSGEFNQQGRIVAGAYDYHLMRGTGSNNKNWYLISDTEVVAPVDPAKPVDPGEEVIPVTPVAPVAPVDAVMITRPEAGSYLANSAAANNMFTLRLQDRGGETQYTDAITGEQKTTSLWMRNVGGHNTSTDSSGQLKTQTNRYVLQIGGDLGKWSFDGNDSLSFGTMAGYGNAQSNTDSKVTGHRSKGQVNGYSLGLYGTWYQNAATQTGAYLDSWAQYSWFNNSVQGDDLPQESYKSKGVSASVESGYRWKVGEDSAKNSYFIEPNAQFVWSNIKADDLTESNGTQVSSQGSGNLQSRVGVRASMKTYSEKQQASFQPYIEANWISNTQNAGATLNDVSIEQRGGKNIAEVRAGVNGKLTERVNLWGNIGQQMGSENYRDSSAMLGVKVSF